MPTEIFLYDQPAGDTGLDPVDSQHPFPVRLIPAGTPAGVGDFRLLETAGGTQSGLYVPASYLVGSSGAALLPNAVALSDALANPTTTEVGANLLVFNGATWDRQYSNTQGTLLASAARTGTTSSANQTNYNARGVYVWLHLTVVPGGSDTLTLSITHFDPVSGASRALTTATSGNVPTGATGVPANFVFAVYPGMADSSGSLGNIEAAPLPRTWGVTVTHSASTSFTYSVGHALIN